MAKKKDYNSGHVAEIILAATVTAACINIALGRETTPNIDSIQNILTDLISRRYDADKVKVVESKSKDNNYELNLQAINQELKSLIFIKTTVDIGEKSAPVALNLKDYTESDGTISEALKGALKYVKSDESYLIDIIEEIRTTGSVPHGYIDIMCNGLTNGQNAKADLIITPYVFDNGSGTVVKGTTLKRELSVKLGTVNQIAQFAGSFTKESGTPPLNKMGEAFGVGELHANGAGQDNRFEYLRDVTNSAYKELVSRFNALDTETKRKNLSNAMSDFISGRPESTKFSLLFLGDKSFKLASDELPDTVEDVRFEISQSNGESFLTMGENKSDGYVNAFKYITPSGEDVRAYISTPKISVSVLIEGKWFEILKIRVKTEFSSSKRITTTKEDGVLETDNGSFIIPAGSDEYGPIIRNLIEVGKDFKKVF